MLSKEHLKSHQDFFVIINNKYLTFYHRVLCIYPESNVNILYIYVHILHSYYTGEYLPRLYITHIMSKLSNMAQELVVHQVDWN